MKTEILESIENTVPAPLAVTDAEWKIRSDELRLKSGKQRPIGDNDDQKIDELPAAKVRWEA